MFPAQCDYYRAADVDEALDLLSAHADREAELLAGGQGLVPDMKTGAASPDVLVDVSEVDGLGGIERTEEGVAVGALATHAEVAHSPTVEQEVPVLAEAASAVADVQIRNRGTIGGNLAEADPGADLPAAALAAGATIDARSEDGERSIQVGEFFQGDGETALDRGEILTRVRIPAADAGAYVRKTDSASGYAIVGVGVGLSVDDGVVSDARVGLTGALDGAVRLPSVEEAVDGEGIADVNASSAVEGATADLDDERLVDEPAISGEYRADLVPAYAERALREAIARAQEGDL